jgi:hypothetical protein
MVASLHLFCCHLGGGFWAGLHSAFPNLSSLRLDKGSSFEAAGVRLYLTQKAAATSVGAPFMLKIYPTVYDDCGGERLKASLTSHESSCITIVSDHA